MLIVALGKPHLGLGLADDLAIVGAVDPRQLVSVLLDKICQAQHHRRPVAAGGLAPDSPERLMAGFDGGPEDRKSTRMNSSHYCASRMPSSAIKTNNIFTIHPIISLTLKPPLTTFYLSIIY